MRIRFERDVEDYIAFNEFHICHSPHLQGRMFRYRWGGALYVFIFPIIIVSFLVPKIPVAFSVTVSLVNAIVFAAWAPAGTRQRIRRNIEKSLAEGKREAMTGEAEMELTETGLRVRSAYFETELAWGAVEKIESTPEYTFLYIGAMNAYIIPHRKIREGDFPAMLAEISRKYQSGQKITLKPEQNRLKSGTSNFQGN